MKIKLTNEEIREYFDIESPEFPKYVTQILNLANRNAQGTRPKVVGQMSNLIKEFDGKTIQEWEKWYLEKNPQAVEKATNRIITMVESLKEAINKIDRKMIETWVKDLVIIKTFLGLRFQEAILKKGAQLKGVEHRLAISDEEAQGIDGWIGNIPVSIKPDTYEVKKELLEGIEATIIFYKKLKDGIEVDYGEIL
ncbi:MAG: restriction endonuclease [bacterium (Candidatus Ratteibacteria) CG23_combo_of_CG06-09_8_20_14_all_48_7]|uniref:Restriction endonuclease n=1 Tax=bacterium (Candidatus Ratteibacteria) CG23_combo_of_CG06-09_8_20_14_all_48_7 TaxID=2014292 RepID=A0A2G9YAP5_9BACT|nr:MAG: restriction endonuclease [bacterium (Candidatus Ratteibacteria) CG23_combo_of_CG06-09_8_20_14_all_48_7]